MIIRPAQVEDAAAIARVHIDSWRSTYQGMIPDDYLARLSYEERTETWRAWLNPPLPFRYHFVAEDETGEIIGFLSGGQIQEPDPLYEGELYAIYLLQERQGQGVGRRLTKALVEKLLQADIDNMLVWVLEQNPARKFYEALGGQFLRKKQVMIGGAILYEVSYGWPAIRVIQANKSKDIL